VFIIYNSPVPNQYAGCFFYSKFPKAEAKLIGRIPTELERRVVSGGATYERGVGESLIKKDPSRIATQGVRIGLENISLSPVSHAPFSGVLKHSEPRGSLEAFP